MLARLAILGDTGLETTCEVQETIRWPTSGSTTAAMTNLIMKHSKQIENWSRLLQ